jgi:hypothetical protein
MKEMSSALRTSYLAAAAGAHYRATAPNCSRRPRVWAASTARSRDRALGGRSRGDATRCGLDEDGPIQKGADRDRFSTLSNLDDVLGTLPAPEVTPAA